MRALPAVVVLSLSPLAAARQDLAWHHSHTLEWDGSALGEGRLVTRMRAGEITGGARLDVVAQGGPANEELLVIDGVATSDGLMIAASGVKDFDLVPRTSSTDVDDIALLDDEGLHRLTWAGPAASPLFSKATICGVAPWLAARLVRCAHVDTGTSVDYVGLGGNLRKILVLRNGTTANQFEPGPRVYDVVPLDWTGDALQEIALLTQTGLLVVDFTGATIDSYSGTYTSASRIARIPLGAGSLDAIAWLTQDAPQDPMTLTCATAAEDLLDPRTLPDDDYVGMSAGDVVSDGKVDLLLARTSFGDAVVLKNLGTTSVPVYDGLPIGMGEQPPFSGAPLANVVVPAFADFDADGTLDQLVPVCTTGAARFELMTSERPFSGEVPGSPNQVPGEWQEVPQEDHSIHLMQINGLFGYCLDWALAVDCDQLGTFGYRDANAPETATHLEVKVWGRDDTNLACSDKVCLSWTLHEIAEADENGVWIVQDVPLPDLVADDPNSLADDQQAIVWIEARFVRTESSTAPFGLVEQAWETSTAVAYLCCDAVLDALPTTLSDAYNYNLRIVVEDPIECVEDECDVFVGQDTCYVTGGPPLGSTQTSAFTVRAKRTPPPGQPATLPSSYTVGLPLIAYSDF